MRTDLVQSSLLGEDRNVSIICRVAYRKCQCVSLPACQYANDLLRSRLELGLSWS